MLISIDIVKSFLIGINGTIFAYGQTGAGKTYSIIGCENKEIDLLNNEKRGILPRTLDQVFQKRNMYNQSLHEYRNDEEHCESTGQTKFFISFFEIYNEKIFDLLSPSNFRITP